MARCRGAFVFALAALALYAVPVSAQIVGRPFEFSAGAGYFAPDLRAHMESGPAYNAAIGWRYLQSLTLEGQGTWAPSHQDTLPGLGHNFSYLSADLRWNLRPADNRMVPFLLGGVGYGLSSTLGTPPPNKLARGAPSIGAGALVNAWNQRTYLRFQVRDVMFRERDQTQFSNHLALTAGLQYAFGGKQKDLDLDGVRDWLDKCPNTPVGATVDANGCPHDQDGDGVLDGLDKCADTPKGCKIDSKGCPLDADGDGVCDGIDTCPDTPKGATVDALGCPHDADADSVLDGIDKCPNTPKGCIVGMDGCPADADSDGVCDGLDLCPNTPVGFRVDEHGCPIEVSERETQLLDTGSIRIQNINFDSGKASITPESFAVIDTVARILQQYPTLQIEVGGHTDSKGSDSLNYALSQSRADAVLQYMKSVRGLDASQYTSKGYGPSVPIAPNTTQLGRAKNRRVEFRVLNTGALRIERDRRRMLKKGEGVPPSGQAPPSNLSPPQNPSVPMTPAAPDTSKHN